MGYSLYPVCVSSSLLPVCTKNQKFANLFAKLLPFDLSTFSRFLFPTINAPGCFLLASRNFPMSLV